MSETIDPRCSIDHALPDARNFSLVLGGPLFQLLRKARLDDDAGGLLRRRLLFITGLVWLPLALLCAIDGKLLGGVDIPFLFDIETHARFLVALPLMILAEVPVHLRMRGIISQFVERGLVPQDDIGRFHAAIRNAMAWRNSVPMEIFLALFVFVAGYFVRTQFLALHSSTWYASVTPEGTALTIPGYWFTWVSNPVMQFIMLRWLYRLVIWARLLWQFSRIKLALLPAHADGNAGLGFLSVSAYAHSPLLAALGAAMAGLVASRIFHEGAVLTDFKYEIVGLVVLGLLLVLGPTMVFAGQILDAKREALMDYGVLAARYTRDFDRRWIRGAQKEHPLLGTSDIQSLADLSNAYAVIRSARPVPITRDLLVQLVGSTLIPFVPLVFTMIPFDVLVKRILQSVI